MNLRKEDDLVKRQAVERRQLPKRIRSEMKAREMMFRESMRISMSQTDSEALRDRLKKVHASIILSFTCEHKNPLFDQPVLC